MDVPQPESITIEGLKTMLADQLLTINQQAQYAQTLIAWGTAAHDELAALKEQLATTPPDAPPGIPTPDDNGVKAAKAKA